MHSNPSLKARKSVSRKESVGSAGEASPSAWAWNPDGSSKCWRSGIQYSIPQTFCSLARFHRIGRDQKFICCLFEGKQSTDIFPRNRRNPHLGWKYSLGEVLDGAGYLVITEWFLKSISLIIVAVRVWPCWCYPQNPLQTWEMTEILKDLNAVGRGWNAKQGGVSDTSAKYSPFLAKVSSSHFRACQSG